MIPYWLLFGFFLFGAALSSGTMGGRQPASLPILFGALVIALMVGLRFDVGADWATYEFLFQFAGRADLWRVLEIGDPGYQFLNWLVKQAGAGFWLVNLVCAAIFAWGLQRFARAQADPWLALVVAIPYLVTVIAIGYTRQSVAIGIILAGLASLQRGSSIPRFALYVATAALFHRTAVVVLPLVVLAADRNQFMNLVGGLAVCIVLYDAFLSDSFVLFVRNYIEAEYSSHGAAIRVAMNLLPAAIFLMAGRRFQFLPRDYNIWRNYSLAAFAMLVLLLVLPSSTAVDRLSLYIIPLQMAVLARMPRAFDSPVLRVAIILYSAAVLFVWLGFATHAQYWLPYRFYPLA